MGIFLKISIRSHIFVLNQIQTILTIHPQYITDNTGKKISVILPIKEFTTIIEELEELEDIRLYDLSKNDNEVAIPRKKVMEMIAAERKKLGK
jgi:hypothetical protein